MMEDMIMGYFDYLDNALYSYVCLGKEIILQA